MTKKTSRTKHLLIITLGILLGLFGALTQSQQEIVHAAVTLVSFTATPGNVSVTLSWETATELDSSGFYITRSTNQASGYSRISEFIPSTGDSVTGDTYNYVDTTVTNGTTFYYQLEAIDSGGQSTYHGPVSATPQSSGPSPTPINTVQPTATNTVEATGTTQPGNTQTPIPTVANTNTSLPSATTQSLPSATPAPTITGTIQASETPSQSETPTTILNTPTKTIAPDSILSIPSLTPSSSATYTPQPQSPPSTAPKSIMLKIGAIALLIAAWVVMGWAYFKFIKPLI